MPSRSRKSIKISPPWSRRRCTQPISTTCCKACSRRNSPQRWVRCNSPPSPPIARSPLPLSNRSPGSIMPPKNGRHFASRAGMMMQDARLYCSPEGGEHIDMRRVRDGRVAPSRAEGWQLTCRSATERLRRVVSGLFACPAVNVGTMQKDSVNSSPLQENCRQEAGRMTDADLIAVSAPISSRDLPRYRPLVPVVVTFCLAILAADWSLDRITWGITAVVLLAGGCVGLAVRYVGSRGLLLSAACTLLLGY